MNSYERLYREYEAQDWPEWSAVTSIDEMSELVIDWLRGKTPVLPWHFGPPAEETSHIRSPLIALNRVPGILTDNSQPGLDSNSCKQRAFVSGFATSVRLTDLVARARHAELVVRITSDIGPDDPVVTKSLDDPNGLLTYARPTPASELALPERAASVLTNTAQPFSVHDPEWGSNRMWRLLVDDAVRH